ncbi:MAG: AAA family ATPase [Prevotella sp.]|nr:AAA family ATPase [Prevotella sp.]
MEVFAIHKGDVSENGQIRIIDEDRLCYIVESNSRGARGIRTISKQLLEEYVNYFRLYPDSSPEKARNDLAGNSDIDKFEYGYTSSLSTMAKMALKRADDKKSSNPLDFEKQKRHLQQIFYGAPGTGKSHAIKYMTEGKRVIRTTFHPDSDYSTFVGAYKPTTIEVPLMTVIGTKAVPVENSDGSMRTETKIEYEFVAQAFLNAYIKAWKLFAIADNGNKANEVYLIIEEINRGNCAQIFGDLFQLLDRGENGFSEYPIIADKDLQKHLAKTFADMPYLNVPAIGGMTAEKVAIKIRQGEILLLPRNFYIWATMNTSDQSLFPIDSAFKRRWDWQYMPISDGKKGWQIEANGKRYDWWQFLQKMNDKIGSTTNSEDKKLGYFFCKAKNNVIDAETFVGKVVFYIWNDVFKDFAEEAGDLFKDIEGFLSFNNFYTIGIDGKAKVVEEKVERLLHNLGLEQTGITYEDEIEVAVGEEALDESAKSQRKETLVSIQIPDNPIILSSDSTQFDAFVKALRIIGIDKIASVLSSLKYKRLDCPVISDHKYDEIVNNDKGYSYYQEGNLFIVKGCKYYTYIRILEDLNKLLNIGLSLETK